MIDSILEALKAFTEFVLGFLLDLLVGLLNLIPAPDFIDSTIQALNTVSDVAAYPLYVVAFDVGFPILISASLIKFFIRRLPFIG